MFQCDACGCIENTALCNYWWETTHFNKKLCSACTNLPGSKGFEQPGACKPKKWHGKFERMYLPLGMFVTDRFGNLMHKVTKDTNLKKYYIVKPSEESTESSQTPE